MNLRKKGRFLPDEAQQYIKDNFSNMHTQTIADALGCSYSTVSNFAYARRIKKSDEFLKEHGRRLQKGDGIAYRFKKGQVSHNKGRKQNEYMSPEGILNTVETRFKKGGKPHNAYAEDGVIVIRKETLKDGSLRPYKWIRLALAKWKQLHVHIWEQDNGPVPTGHLVVFKDKDTMNCVLENLELITRKENMQRNSYHRFGEEIAGVIQLRGALTRKINKKIKKLNS